MKKRSLSSDPKPTIAASVLYSILPLTKTHMRGFSVSQRAHRNCPRLGAPLQTGILYSVEIILVSVLWLWENT